MKCDCGSCLFSSTPAAMQCRCGRVHYVEPQTPPERKPGSVFADKIRPFLTSRTRNCRLGDAEALINHWADNMTKGRKCRIVKLITGTHAAVGQAFILQAIEESIESYHANS